MTKTLFVFLFVFFTWSTARADSTITQWKPAQTSNGVWVNSPAEACAQYANYVNNYAVAYYASGTAYCKKLPRDGTSSNEEASLSVQQGCPGGVAPDYSKPAAQQCPSACSDVSKYNRRFTYTANPVIAPTHWDNCEIVIDQLLVCRKGADGDFCMWQFHRTGNAYKGADTPTGGGGNPDTKVTADDTTLPTTSSPPFSNTASNPKTCSTCIPCPSGSVNMGVDQEGVPLCVGTGTNPPAAPTTPTTTTTPDKTTQNSDGSTTTIGVKTQQNSDGSTTTTTTTTVVKADGTKTVSVGAATSNNTAGNAGTTDNPNSDQNNLCKQNPNLTICRNSTVSGSCGAISCTGDAIQCATLRATAAMQCKQQSDDDAMKASTEYALGKAVMSGNDPMAATLPDPKKADTVTMSSGDATGWLGAGAYFKDKTISIPGGSSIVLPFSQGQSVMLGLRYVTMIVCSLVSFAIIRGTVNRS